MITAVFENFNYEQGFVNSSVPFTLKVKGHAQFSVKGSDIVCSAVSALVQTLFFTVENNLRIPIAKFGDKDYSLQVDSKYLNKDFLLLVCYLYNGLRLIEDQYPDYVVLKEN